MYLYFVLAASTCTLPTIQSNMEAAPVKSTYNYDDTVTYSCKSGFVISGDKTTYKCGESDWIGPLPVCNGEPLTVITRKDAPAVQK